MLAIVGAKNRAKNRAKFEEYKSVKLDVKLTFIGVSLNYLIEFVEDSTLRYHVVLGRACSSCSMNLSEALGRLNPRANPSSRNYERNADVELIYSDFGLTDSLISHLYCKHLIRIENIGCICNMKMISELCMIGIRRKCSGNLWNDLKWHVVVFEKERVPTRDIEMEVTWLHENAAIPNSSNLSLDYMQGQFCASSYRDKNKETKLKTNE
ncbi:hypothetical protein V1477_006731 [Vespula maculifrons]|uniref:Uncharacterized protein n=1 Tax=Vespula maculifrons TaxID=7453 RepID=A0ABD2CGI6_VESMC